MELVFWVVCGESPRQIADDWRWICTVECPGKLRAGLGSVLYCHPSQDHVLSHICLFESSLAWTLRHYRFGDAWTKFCWYHFGQHQTGWQCPYVLSQSNNLPLYTTADRLATSWWQTHNKCGRVISLCQVQRVCHKQLANWLFGRCRVHSHLPPTAPPPDLRRLQRVLRHEKLWNYVTWPAWENWNVFQFNWCLYSN